MPHRPNTTDGTTATRSMSADRARGFSHGGATWVVNRAMPRLTGTAMTTAISAVTAVPKMKRARRTPRRRAPSASR